MASAESNEIWFSIVVGMIIALFSVVIVNSWDGRSLKHYLTDLQDRYDEPTAKKGRN